MFRGVICCSGGLYADQVSYMDVQWGYMVFRGVICCSVGLYAICCSGGLYDEENNDDFTGHKRRSISMIVILHRKKCLLHHQACKVIITIANTLAKIIGNR